VAVSALLVPTLARLGLKGRARLIQVAHAWTAVVGDAVASETRVASYRRGRVGIETSSPALSHQLHLQRQVIIDGLNLALAEAVVNDLRFSLMPEAARMQKAALTK
jgi:predicted nucleic acid-binding Zn ribbon protein